MDQANQQHSVTSKNMGWNPESSLKTLNIGYSYGQLCWLHSNRANTRLQSCHITLTDHVFKSSLHMIGVLLSGQGFILKATPFLPKLGTFTNIINCKGASDSVIHVTALNPAAKVSWWCVPCKRHASLTGAIICSLINLCQLLEGCQHACGHIWSTKSASFRSNVCLNSTVMSPACTTDCFLVTEMKEACS